MEHAYLQQRQIINDSKQKESAANALIGLIIGGLAGYLVCLKQDAINGARVDEKVG